MMKASFDEENDEESRFRMRQVIKLQALVLLVSSAFSAPLTAAAANANLPAEGSKTAALPATVELPAHLISIPTHSEYYGPYVFVVDKSARTLDIWKSESDSDGHRHFNRLASYPADMGKNMGDKVSEGDHKTPEGIYFLLDRLEGAGLDFKLYGSRAYVTDYPNHFDELDGKTGKGIWLHSVPDEVPLTRGSRGCVVVRNEIIKALDPYIRLNRTPIIISEKIETRSRTDADAAQIKLEAWLENWRKTWESKAHAAYMAFYDEKFKAMGMDKAQWSQYKSRLNKQYGAINVRLSQPIALEQRGRAIVRFLQSYSSDKLSDVGEKTLHLVNRNGEWKILSETWKADDSAPARAALAIETKTAANR